MTVFAEEAHRQLDKLVSASFQAFEANDPRPHARQVQKQELCKVIKEEVTREVQFCAKTVDYYSIGSDAGHSVVTDVVAVQASGADLTSSQALKIQAAATPATPSEVSSVVSSAISADGLYDHYGADAVSVASSDCLLYTSPSPRDS